MIGFCVLLIIGFIILIKGADYFVEGASSIASHLKISKILIGLTIMAFGTSLPEFAVSMKSLTAGSGDIVLGNVIGSNILNVLLILGICAIIHPLDVRDNTVKKELPITMLITTLFAVLLADNVFDKSLPNVFTRSDGMILLLFFSIFIYYLLNISKKKVLFEKKEKNLPVKRAILFTIIGILGVTFGCHFVVESAISLARTIGVSERLISLTIIAFGTALPELVTSVTATRKGEYDIAIGNVVGSNIFNVGVVIGIPVTLLGGIGVISFSYIDLLVMVSASIILFMFSFNDYKITYKEGVILLMMFITYYSYVLIS
jgi:cation:H+ antiporter